MKKMTEEVKGDPYEIKLFNLTNGWAVLSIGKNIYESWSPLTKKEALSRFKKELGIK